MHFAKVQEKRWGLQKKKKKKLFQVPHLAPTQDFELKGIYSADKDVYLTSEPTVYCVILQ